VSTRVLMTRSENLLRVDPLDGFFNVSQEEAETFYDAMATTIQTGGDSPKEDMIRRIVSGKPDRVKMPARLTDEVSGFVRVIHGPHGEDYVWHVEHAALRRPWKTTNERIIFIIATIMHDCLPDIEAKIWPPAGDWELRTITFKALGLVDEWTFHESLVQKINLRLFAALNPLV